MHQHTYYYYTLPGSLVALSHSKECPPPPGNHKSIIHSWREKVIHFQNIDFGRMYCAWSKHVLQEDMTSFFDNFWKGICHALCSFILICTFQNKSLDIFIEYSLFFLEQLVHTYHQTLLCANCFNYYLIHALQRALGMGGTKLPEIIHRTQMVHNDF